MWICDHSKKRAISEDSKIKLKNEVLVNKIKKVPPLVGYGTQEWVCNHHKHVERNPEKNLITQWKYKRLKLNNDKTKKINDEEQRDASRQRRHLNSLKRQSISYDKQLLDHYRRMVNETYNEKYNHLFKNNKGEFKNKFYRGIQPSPIKFKNITSNIPIKSEKCMKKNRVVLKSMNYNESNVLNSTPINESIHTIRLDKVRVKKRPTKNLKDDKINLLKEEYVESSTKIANLSDDGSINGTIIPHEDSFKVKYSGMSSKQCISNLEKQKKLNCMIEFSSKKTNQSKEHVEFDESDDEIRDLFTDKSNGYGDDSFITDVSMESLSSLKNNKIDKNKDNIKNKSSSTDLCQNLEINNDTKVPPNSLINSAHDEDFIKRLTKSAQIDNEENFVETIFESSNEKIPIKNETDIPLSENHEKNTTNKNSKICNKKINKKSLFDKTVQLNQNNLPMDNSNDDITNNRENLSSKSSSHDQKEKAFYEEYRKDGSKRLIIAPKLLSKSHPAYLGIHKNSSIFKKKYTKSVDRMSYNSISSKEPEVKNSKISLIKSTNLINTPITEIPSKCDYEIEKTEFQSENLISRSINLKINNEINTADNQCVKEENSKSIQENIDKKSHSSISREGSSTSSQQKSINIVKPYVIVSDLAKFSNDKKIVKLSSDSISSETSIMHDEPHKKSQLKMSTSKDDTNKPTSIFRNILCYYCQNETKEDEVKLENSKIGPNTQPKSGQILTSDKEVYTDEWVDSGKTKLGLKLEK